jgi:hypothetical protein
MVPIPHFYVTISCCDLIITATRHSSARISGCAEQFRPSRDGGSVLAVLLDAFLERVVVFDRSTQHPQVIV